jgi:hypothetical protein
MTICIKKNLRPAVIQRVEERGEREEGGEETNSRLLTAEVYLI